MSDHILVIDDDPNIVSAVRESLELDGYRVASAGHGLAGLAALEDDRPSVVLLDMRMPIMDGWTFAREARRRGAEMPIVVMTAAADAAAWAREVEASAFLAKPFTLDDLLDTVERLRTP